MGHPPIDLVLLVTGVSIHSTSLPAYCLFRQVKTEAPGAADAQREDERVRQGIKTWRRSAQPSRPPDARWQRHNGWRALGDLRKRALWPLNAPTPHLLSTSAT